MSEKDKKSASSEAEHREKHLVDFVWMQAPPSTPGADDGEVVKVPNNTLAISRKMFAGYHQVDSAKGNKE